MKRLILLLLLFCHPVWAAGQNGASTPGMFPVGTFTSGDCLKSAGGIGVQDAGSACGGTISIPVACTASVTPGFALATGTGPAAMAFQSGTINSATIIGSLSAGTCSATVDIWKVNAALPTVANTITAMDLPTLTSSSYYQDTTLSGWTTSVSANDVFVCNIQSTTCDTLSVILSVSQ